MVIHVPWIWDPIFSHIARQSPRVSLLFSNFRIKQALAFEFLLLFVTTDRWYSRCSVVGIELVKINQQVARKGAPTWKQRITTHFISLPLSAHSLSLLLFIDYLKRTRSFITQRTTWPRRNLPACETLYHHGHLPLRTGLPTYKT